MARIVKIAKYVQVPGPGGFLRPAPRRAPAKPPALYLLQLRASVQTRSPQRRLTIAIAAPVNPDIRPEPVKIVYT
jgi:hypothetical protein